MTLRYDNIVMVIVSRNVDLKVYTSLLRNLKPVLSISRLNRYPLIR